MSPTLSHALLNSPMIFKCCANRFERAVQKKDSDITSGWCDRSSKESAVSSRVSAAVYIIFRHGKGGDGDCGGDRPNDGPEGAGESRFSGIRSERNAGCCADGLWWSKQTQSHQETNARASRRRSQNSRESMVNINA